MLAGLLKFDKIPKIGFTHHYYSEHYCNYYSKKKSSFEIVYINKGTIKVEFKENIFYAKEGSILVLFRHLPIKLSSLYDSPQEHCTIQIVLDYDFELIDDENCFSANGVILPFITKPCNETEELKKDLYDITYKLSLLSDEQDFICSLKAISIIKKLDEIARSKHNLSTSACADNICASIKNYVNDNIAQKISLSDVALFLGKTPNYINAVFKKAEGITINHYICKEKVHLISYMIQKENIPFPLACKQVGITDVSYGYRIFKKIIGITPKEFLKSYLIYE